MKTILLVCSAGMSTSLLVTKMEIAAQEAGDEIKIFALPIIIGLLAGTYSSICISPAIWASWKDRKKKDKPSEPKKELKKAATV